MAPVSLFAQRVTVVRGDDEDAVVVASVLLQIRDEGAEASVDPAARSSWFPARQPRVIVIDATAARRASC